MKQIEVVAAIIIQDNTVLIAQRQKDEFAGMWEFPGGKIESGETHEVALIREIQEELNLPIEVKEFLMKIDYDYPNFHLTMHCYFCTALVNHFENIEHSDVKYVRITDLDKQHWIPADVQVAKEIQRVLGTNS